MGRENVSSSRGTPESRQFDALEPPRLRTGFSFAGGAALGLFAAWLALGGNQVNPGAGFVTGTMATGINTTVMTTVDRLELPLETGRAVIETKLVMNKPRVISCLKKACCIGRTNSNRILRWCDFLRIV